ncbi:MAG: type II secretion system F family protein [Desulfurellaceae bacterium]|nr:type II secretion system F family protein [Desulfurellaceae bacterium]
MPIFRWQGVGPRGERLTGEMDAASPAVVRSRLRAERIRPLDQTIRPKRPRFGAGLSIPGLGHKVRQKDLVVFTRQFATMIDAGLPLIRGLDIVARQTDNTALQDILRQVRHDVANGTPLAEAMAKHPKIFTDLYTSMVSAGEVGGILDTILTRLAGSLEKALRLKSSLTGALIYPLSIITVAMAVSAVLLIFVVPVFARMFASFGQALPLPTQLAIQLSDFLQTYISQLLILLVGLILGLRSLYRTQAGRSVIDRGVLRFPLFGPLIRKAAVARFTRTLATLLSSGVPLPEALLVTGSSAGNTVVERAVLAAHHAIRQGKALSEPLAASQVFPPMVSHMIEVGEQTGALDRMLEKIADFYEQEVDATVANLSALLEPVVIVFLGLVIGGLVVAMYLPIFTLGAAMMG